MKKLFIILACLCLVFMASNILIASGGGGGGGGGGGDGSPTQNQEPLYKKSDFPPLEQSPPKDAVRRAFIFCFIETVAQEVQEQESRLILASGGGGGGGGGGDDPKTTQESLFPSKTYGPSKPYPSKEAEEKAMAEEVRQYKQYQNDGNILIPGVFFIDTASQNSLLDELLNFVWKPKSE